MAVADIDTFLLNKLARFAPIFLTSFQLENELENELPLEFSRLKKKYRTNSGKGSGGYSVASYIGSALNRLYEQGRIERQWLSSKDLVIGDRSPGNNKCVACYSLSLKK